MDLQLAAFLLVAFLAVVLLIEGSYNLWNSSKGPEARRLERRLRTLSAGVSGPSAANLLKRSEQDLPAFDRMLLRVPRLQTLDRLIAQAGADWSVTRLATVSVMLAVGVLILSAFVGWPLLLELIFAVAAGLTPLGWIMLKRRKRLKRLEQQMPEACDLISRALRAGHAFQSGLQMVADEMTEPIADEFAVLADEINYGVPVHDAFMNLSVRIPLDDVRFFSIAVLLQRETGGNLAEILNNISALMRSRFRLLGKVRALAAEGKLSAWILTLLPIGTALVILAINPKFMSTLWTDPAGLFFIYTCVTLMVVGIFWMWRIIKIRV